MNQQQILALELFHVLYINKLCYSPQHDSWVDAVPNSDRYAKISFQNITLNSAMFLSGITFRYMPQSLVKK